MLVMVVWLLPIRLARSVATCERLPTTPSRSEFFDASADDTVCRFVTRLSMSPERDARAVSTWSRLPMIEPTWVSRASTVLETAAPLLMSWLICAVSPSSAPDTFSTNWLASVGLIDESTGPSEFKNVSTLASVTSWLSGIVDPVARIGPALPGKSSISFWPMTFCQRIPTSVDLRSVTVLLMLMEMTACPCCTPMLVTCPTGTPAMFTLSPLASPVTSVSCALTVCRLLKSEMLPILHGQARQEHEADRARRSRT